MPSGEEPGIFSVVFFQKKIAREKPDYLYIQI